MTNSTTSICAEQALITARRLLHVEDVLAAGPAGGYLNGLAGTALLHARLASVDPAHATAAAEHWTAAATTSSRVNPSGIFSSPVGLAASLIIGGPYLPDPQPHQGATVRAASWLSALVIDLTSRHHHRLNVHTSEVPPHAYDTITGLAGIGRILLAAIDAGHRCAEPGLHAALTFLTTMILHRPDGKPAWWLPADHPDSAGISPSGTAATGMAHGIAGPLALLSTAYSSGHTVHGHSAAIQAAAEWLLRWRTNDVWPPHITGDEIDIGIPSPMPGRADAWCYGIPGISRALILAGQATGDTRFTDAADTALAHLDKRPADQWDVDGPTLCHGYAGVLQSTMRNGDSIAERAADMVMDMFDAAHRFAFQHRRYRSVYDHPGLLTGAAGVALALADHGRLPAPAVRTLWDAILLLS